LLGYAVDNGCAIDCPRVVQAAFDERDLDAFAATVAGDHVIVGAFQPSSRRDYVPRWLDFDHHEHQDRELDLETARRPGAPMAIAHAMQLPVGRYALVTGSLVQSTADAPQLCDDAQRCVLAFGVATIAVNQHATHAASGTMLVRRAGRGLVVVAASRFDR
jgi:hypothetical protein